MPKHKISKKLQEEYAAGKTQVELAQMYNVSQATINKLLTDPKASENLKVSFVKRMFPNATISLNGAEFDTELLKNLKTTVENIKKLVNDSTIPDEKKVKLIKILLD
jgi:DNA-binding transcriptional regulator LsrR (DeoR family)